MLQHDGGPPSSEFYGARVRRGYGGRPSIDSEAFELDDYVSSLAPPSVTV